MRTGKNHHFRSFKPTKSSCGSGTKDTIDALSIVYEGRSQMYIYFIKIKASLVKL
jgi:hypothetical protein